MAISSANQIQSQSANKSKQIVSTIILHCTAHPPQSSCHQILRLPQWARSQASVHLAAPSLSAAAAPPAGPCAACAVPLLMTLESEMRPVREESYRKWAIWTFQFQLLTPNYNDVNGVSTETKRQNLSDAPSHQTWQEQLPTPTKKWKIKMKNIGAIIY